MKQWAMRRPGRLQRTERTCWSSRSGTGIGQTLRRILVGPRGGPCGCRPQDTAAKQLALAAHVSQTQPLSSAAGDEVLLSDTFQEHFDRGVEIFAWTPAGPAGSAHAEQIFDRLYRSDPDPWNYLSSWYERRKRAVFLTKSLYYLFLLRIALTASPRAHPASSSSSKNFKEG